MLNHRHNCASCVSITRKACLPNKPVVLICAEKTIPPLYIERTGSVKSSVERVVFGWSVKNRLMRKKENQTE